MSNAPILLFLHGVGDADRDDPWKSVLAQTLARVGYPELDSAQVIAPKYAHALMGWDDKCTLPGVTVKQPSGDAARKNRREFERRIGALEFRLGRHDHGEGLIGGEAVTAMALELPFLRQAHNYLGVPQIRAQVLSRILEKLPASGTLVVVGHSLGSVIAADLIPRLPAGIDVAGMVTIGSPLASGKFDVDRLRDTLREPPTNLATWVNFWNGADPVAARRGVSSVFPWLLDVQIRTKAIGVAAHLAVDYLANDAVAEAIGFALFGSRSRELAALDKGVEIPLNTVETYTVLALRYAHLIKPHLHGEVQDRFVGALRQVQATAVETIRQQNQLARRPMPSAIAHLAFDLSDPQSELPEPTPVRHFSKDEAVVPLTVLAAENILRPFEISIPKEKSQIAMQDLTAEMGLTSQFGTDVFTSAKRARGALSNNRGLNWIKWGAIGVGAAALVFATGGLVLAAGAGLAGAAAITSALATFGPGGMIGGLLTAGTLVTAGGGGIAFGLASPGTSADTLEAVVTRQLSAAILRQLHQLEQDPTVWTTLVETEIAVRRDHERLDEFSDETAATLKELKRKSAAIDRALKYLSDNGLEPGAGPMPKKTEE